MTRSSLLRARLVAVCAMAMLLSGCGMWDTVSGWFSVAHKSNLKGLRVSLVSLDQELRPDPTLAKIQVILPAPYRNPEWPQPGGYASSAMYHLEGGGSLKELWNVDAGKGTDDDSHLTASPVVAAGRVYVLDAEAHVRVFRVADGARVWDKRLAPKNGTDMPTLWGLLGKPNTIQPPKGMGGGVAFDGGKLFATSGFGDVVAMDAATGRELWRQKLGVPIINAPVVSGGRIFISGHDNHFFALAEADGRVLWNHQGITESAGFLVSTSAAVSGGFVIAPYTSGEIFALNVENGQAAWSDVLSRSGHVTSLSELDDIAGRPVIDRDLVFAISQSGVLAAVSLSTGERLWSHEVGGIQTPWVAGDYVYVTTNDGQLLCLTRKEGKVRWAHQLPRWENPDDKTDPIVWAGPVLVSNRLILTSSNGYAESVSPYSGALLGRVEIPEGTIIAPTVANGTLYLYTNDADLVALR